MKKVMYYLIIISIILSLVWAKLYNVYYNTEGNHFISPTFAMMNKSLFLKKNEYNSYRKLDKLTPLIKENGIRDIYLELSIDNKLDKTLKAIDYLDLYGINIGFWYNHQRLTNDMHKEIVNQLDILTLSKASTSNNAVKVFFVQNLEAKEIVTYKDTYINNIIQLTGLVKQKFNNTVPISIGWILPAIEDEMQFDITHNGYTKRMYYHVLDFADEIAFIPIENKQTNKKQNYLEQILNEAIYAKKKDKIIHIALTFTADSYSKTKLTDDLANLLLQYQELAKLDSRNKTIFMEKGVVEDFIKTRYDLNNDNKVNVKDFLLFLNAYITKNAKQQHDFNKDNIVNIKDLIAIFFNIQ